MLIKVSVCFNLVLLVYPSYGPWKSLNLILTNGQEPCTGKLRGNVCNGFWSLVLIRYCWLWWWWWWWCWWWWLF